jgi:phage repressor protein C with HTH and peptisase S24 domain
MNTLAERLAWARTQKNLSQAALAKLSGVSQSTIGNLESGLRLSARRLAHIAETLEVSALWLAEGIGSPTSEQSYAEVVVRDSNEHKKVPVRRVELRLSAGVTGFQAQPDFSYGGTFMVDEDWILENGYVRERLIAIRVKGESMEPALYDGDTVVINTLDTLPSDGVVFAVNYEGEALVKRLVRDAGQWWLYSDNPDQRRFHRKLCQGDSCILVGRIVKREGNRI